LEITPDTVIEHRTNPGKYVWKKKILPYRVKRLNPSFTITGNNDAWDIDVKSTRSKFFSYLINASRVYWSEELEQRLEEYDGDGEAYRREHKFSINGKLLTDEEIDEQKQHLINKIFAIGYLLHRYKMESRAWCVLGMDWKISEDVSECNGRSGKSFCLKTIRRLLTAVTLPGRNKKLTENNHIFDRVTEQTDFLYIDDADQYFPFDFFFDSVTGEYIINPKNNKSYEIMFDRAPKMAITTNYAPRKIDPSIQARLLYMVFSDYYHEKTDKNGYRETRSIRDDFNMDLFSVLYPVDDWNADINFLVDCLQFYLTTIEKNVKINPPMKNVNQRILLAGMVKDFHEWALTYFSPEGDNVDKTVIGIVAKKDFMENASIRDLSTQRFNKSLEAFCEKYGYTLNPKEFQNDKGRIIEKENGKTYEMIYVRTTDKKATPF
jgi:hypothetical protein